MAEYTFVVAAAPVPYRQPPANKQGGRFRPLVCTLFNVLFRKDILNSEK